MKPHIFTVRMQSEEDGSVSWSVNRAIVASGHIDNPMNPVRIQSIGIETFIIPGSFDPIWYLGTVFASRGLDSESISMILEGV